MTQSTLTVRAAQFAVNALGVLTILLPYWLIVGTIRAARWLVTVGVPHGAFYLGLGLVLGFLGTVAAIRYCLEHGPETFSAIRRDGGHLVASAWSRVGSPARFMIGGTATAVAVVMTLFVLLAAL